MRILKNFFVLSGLYVMTASSLVAVEKINPIYEKKRPGGSKKVIDRLILEELKKNPRAYSCVEVMACPGGCIGGGGQPVPADSALRTKRAAGLYKIDASKKLKIAHLNPIVQKTYKEFLTNEKIIRAICHAKYDNPINKKI